MTLRWVSIISSVIILSCSSGKQESIANDQRRTESDQASTEIINQTIEAHGGDFFEKGIYSFDFRGKRYSFSLDKKGTVYESMDTAKAYEDKHVLDNKGLVVYKDDIKTTLSKKDSSTYAEHLNAVIYFATLPYKLKDSAVISRLDSIVNIHQQAYYQVNVKFSKLGGGKDYEDEFMFWINKTNHKLDYLAYRYHVNGGGIRFRKAINTRTINGVTFQDYINLKPQHNKTPLDSLPILFERSALLDVSMININGLQWSDQQR